MSESIHGHKVLEMMMQDDRIWTTESLISEIERTFGAEAHFNTCSATNMSAAELVNLLRKRGKFIDVENGFTANSSEICQH